MKFTIQNLYHIQMILETFYKNRTQTLKKFDFKKCKFMAFSRIGK